MHQVCLKISIIFKTRMNFFLSRVLKLCCQKCPLWTYQNYSCKYVYLIKRGWKGERIGGFENIFVRISDSKRDFNGFADSAIAADCGFIHFFWARILDFACNKSIFAQISDSGEILTADLVNKSWRIGGFAYPYSPPSLKVPSLSRLRLY